MKNVVCGVLKKALGKDVYAFSQKFPLFLQHLIKIIKLKTFPPILHRA